MKHCYLSCLNILNNWRIQDFPEVGRGATTEAGANTLFDQLFLHEILQNCMK